MASFGLKAELREGTGKGVARSLRRAGRIPAVVYGVGDPTAISLSGKDLFQLLHSHGGDHAVIDLDIEGAKNKQVVIRDYQSDPIKGNLLHCDLYEVQKGHKVTVTVGVVLVGETPEGVREQGILQHALQQIELDCLPGDIPEQIEVDASELKIGESIHVSDLTIADTVHVHAAPDTIVVNISAPKIAASDEDGETADEAVAEETTDGE